MIRLITHTDLDGAGCEILFRAVFGDDTTIITADYGDVDDKVKGAVVNMAFDDKLFITDINIKKETADFVNEYAQFMDIVLIDHHKTSTHLKDYRWCIINTDNTACGTEMFGEFLRDGGFINVTDEYRDFVRIVDDYDRWIHLYPQSKKHNDLFYLIGREDYVDRMLADPRIELSATELALLDVEEASKKRYLQSMRNKVYSVVVEYEQNGETKYINLPYCFAEKYTSELGNYLVEEIPIPVIAIINMKDKKVSLRSAKYFDCSPIAKHYGGGGHPQACGFEIPMDNFDVILDKIFWK